MRTHLRGSRAIAHAISASVSIDDGSRCDPMAELETNAALHAGISLPNASGQSGTDSAEPVELTKPPTKMRQKVAPASSTAKRCSPRVFSTSVGD